MPVVAIYHNGGNKPKDLCLMASPKLFSALEGLDVSASPPRDSFLLLACSLSIATTGMAVLNFCFPFPMRR